MAAVGQIRITENAADNSQHICATGPDFRSVNYIAGIKGK